MKTIPKYLVFVIGVLLLFVTACSSKGKIYSEWRFQNRETGEYLYEEDGLCKFGSEKMGESSLWEIEATPGEEIYIKNKKSGRYLSLDGDRVTCVSVEGECPESAQWFYGNFDFATQKNCGWYTISNKTTGIESRLAAENGSLKMTGSDRNTDFSSHWTLVREKGSPLSFAFTPNSVTDASFLGQRMAEAVSATEIKSDYHGSNVWKLNKDISGFPKFSTENNLLMEALYNMALEEMLLDVRTDSTFMAGALWPDTWTRDAVYSIYFSYAWIMPDESRKTLEKQTLKNPEEALQDTGSGGSWPISTDRVVWAMAAWEYYLYTGDKGWLASVYEGLGNTARKDIHVAFDKNVGLFKGETCSMDWRTHTYPNWFTNAMIGSSFSCGTNALHLFLYEFLFRSAELLGKPESEASYWKQYHDILKTNINKYFWNEKKGLYDCYLYPEISAYKATGRVGVMSNGLCAILGAATEEQSKEMVENYPLYQYGAAVLYPSIPDDFSYHNKSIWPVWQTPYMYAARQAGNVEAVNHMVKSLMRQSALFLTHKENMTYDTGYDRGTALNSSRQLWSVSSYISMVYRVLFGINLTEEGVSFNPVVPEMVNGKLSLSGFKYRNALIDVNVKGNGNKIKSLKVNGEEKTLPYILPAASEGHYVIDMEMVAGAPDNKINLVQAGPGKCWSPVEPVLSLRDSVLTWEQEDGLKYYLHADNDTEDKLVTSPYSMKDEPSGFYSVYSVDNKNGFQSDMSNPVIHTTRRAVYEAEQASHSGTLCKVHPGYTGTGFVVDLCAKPADLGFTVELPEDGDYMIVLRGANGHGPDGTYCAIRSVFVDGKDTGTFILEATGDWTTWMNSNYIGLRGMKAGTHTVKLSYDPDNNGYDFNMSHGKENANDCHIDHLEVIKL